MLTTRPACLITCLCILSLTLQLRAETDGPFDNRLGQIAKEGYTGLITLPAGYHDADKKSLQYGSIVLLHGAGGNEATWAQLADLRALANTYQRIIVSPSCGSHSWYVDKEAGKGAETALVNGLLPAVDKRYRTKANDRWITGFSMGGYGALWLGHRYPDKFSAVGALSPCILPSKWESQWFLHKAMGPVSGRERFDIMTNAAAWKKFNRPLSLLCGSDDFFYVECHWAHGKLTALGKNHMWQDLQGAHDQRFWRAYLPRQLAWFAEETKRRAAAAEGK